MGPLPFYEGSNNNFTVPRRKGSLNVDPSASGLNSPISIDDRFYGTPDLYAVPSLSGSLNGTRRLRAPSTTRRSTLFGGKMVKFIKFDESFNVFLCLGKVLYNFGQTLQTS